MVAISEVLVSAWAKGPGMRPAESTSGEMQTQPMLEMHRALPGAAGQAVPLNAPARETSTKPPAPEKKPLLPPGFDFVRLPNGELKLVPQQGLQAQRRRESNAASKLIVNASKEARRLVRGVYKEHRNAAGRRGLVSGGKSASPHKRSDVDLPPILQESSSAATRIAALRALEALGSINLNPTVRHPPQQADIGNPWAARPNGGVLGLSQPAPLGPPPSSTPRTEGAEPLHKRPRFKAPGATVFKAAPTPPRRPPPPPQPEPPALPANMLWVPSQVVNPQAKPNPPPTQALLELRVAAVRRAP